MLIKKEKYDFSYDNRIKITSNKSPYLILRRLCISMG